jgi:hypothetical protein
LFCIYTIIMHKLFIEIISNHLLLLMIDWWWRESCYYYWFMMASTMNPNTANILLIPPKQTIIT